MAPASRAIAQARFDSSPEATLARRYEAAAERGIYRAIRAIAGLIRQASRVDDGNGLAAELQSSVDLLSRFPLSTHPAGPLASFRVGVFPPTSGSLGPAIALK